MSVTEASKGKHREDVSAAYAGKRTPFGMRFGCVRMLNQVRAFAHREDLRAHEMSVAVDRISLWGTLELMFVASLL
jgi:hypothetical protein